MHPATKWRLALELSLCVDVRFRTERQPVNIASHCRPAVSLVTGFYEAECGRALVLLESHLQNSNTTRGIGDTIWFSNAVAVSRAAG